jgi:hypothetical protein
MMRSISRSLWRSGGKPFIFCAGQLRTDFGSRIRACSPAFVFGGIHREVEVRPDIGRTAAVQFVTRQALGDVERLAGAHGIVRRQALIDGQPRRGLADCDAAGMTWNDGANVWWAPGQLNQWLSTVPIS